MVSKPIVLLPFLIIAFLDGLALELIYFSSREPLARIAGPVIRKFFGEAFVHYPGNLVILPKLLYYAQILIYIFIGAFLAGITVNIVKNIRTALPLKLEALINNALKRYLPLFIFAVIAVVSMFLLKRVNVYFFYKLPAFILALILFFSNIVLQAFLVLTIPIIVIKKKGLFKALGESVILGLRNFLSIFTLISLPFLVYLPVTLLKTGAPKLMEKTFPEISLLISSLGIILSVVMECFIIICVSQFILDKEKAAIKQ